MGEKKRAISFVQSLKRRLITGEKIDTISDRKLASDELSMLKEMNIRLKRTTGCNIIDMVVIDERGRARTVMVGKK